MSSSGPRPSAATPTSTSIHAGTATVDGHLVTAGGRVLAVTATGVDVADARAQAYEGVAMISFPGAQWRRDIAPAVTRPAGYVTVPNVLATRYAAPDLAAIWSPEHKIVLERRLWIAVLRAQRDLGVDVPDGVVEAYEKVVDDVDLASSRPASGSPGTT